MNAAVQANEVQVRVWSRYVRLFHWSLVGCVAVAWLSSGVEGRTVVPPEVLPFEPLLPPK